MVISLYVCGFVFFVVVGYNLFKKSKTWSDPAALFCFVYATSYFVIPIIALCTKQQWHQFEYTQETQFIAFICLFVFGACVLIGNALVSKKQLLLSSDRGVWQPLSKTKLVICGLLLLIPAFFALSKTFALIRLYTYQLFLADRIILRSGSGYENMPGAWFLVWLLLYFINAKMTKVNFLTTLISFVSLSLAMVGGLAMGSRTTTVLPILLLILAALFMNTKSQVKFPKKLVFSAVLILLMGVYLGPIRKQIVSGSKINVMQASTSITSPLIRGGLGEFENVWWLVENKSQWEILGGKTFISPFVGFVPRKMWPNKPLGGGPYLRNFIVPGSYNLFGGKNLTSYTTGLPAEALMNFGFVGFIIIGFLYGLALGLLGRIRDNLRTPLGIATWLIVLFRLVLATKSEFFGMMAHIFMGGFPLFMVSIIFTIISPHIYVRKNFPKQSI